MDSRPDFLIAATPDMSTEFARKLSPEHRREISELGRLPPEEALRLSIAGSLESYACLPPEKDKPVFLFGVESSGSITQTAMVWMLATPEITRHPIVTIRAARWGLARAFAITNAECLEQYIPDWYQTGLHFVRHLGFSTAPFPTPVGNQITRVTLHRGQWMALCKHRWRNRMDIKEKEWES